MMENKVQKMMMMMMMIADSDDDDAGYNWTTLILADGRHDKDVAVEEYPSDQEEKTKQLRCNKSLALYCVSLHFVQVPFFCVNFKSKSDYNSKQSFSPEEQNNLSSASLLSQI